MGMYTQYRGTLCIKSIGGDSTFDQIADALKHAQEIFELRSDLQRAHVCRDCVLHTGTNGAVWLSIGSEHKDYDNSMSEWLDTISRVFQCEGRVECQYEEQAAWDEITVYWFDTHGVSKSSAITRCDGYGFRGGIR